MGERPQANQGGDGRDCGFPLSHPLAGAADKQRWADEIFVTGRPAPEINRVAIWSARPTAIGALAEVIAANTAPCPPDRIDGTGKQNPHRNQRLFPIVIHRFLLAVLYGECGMGKEIVSCTVECVS